MTWFDSLTGFTERSGDDVRGRLLLDGTKLTSTENNRTMDAGVFSLPSLSQLRDSVDRPANEGSRTSVAEVVADIQSLHQDPLNENAVFQVASQFNCLEMAAPHMTPEDGVGIYENDRTQGPACSISAGAGTIFRNYFVRVDGQLGQTRDKQLDGLSDVGVYFENPEKQLWKMQNGYCFPTHNGLVAIERHLADCSEGAQDQILRALRVGVQKATEVTLGSSRHRVTQVFCSGMPISYSNIEARVWNRFPQLILNATYEATFHVAFQNMCETGCRKLYLTLVGGGVFGNRIDWILSAIRRSWELFSWAGLDVKIVSYRQSRPEVVRFLQQQGAA